MAGAVPQDPMHEDITGNMANQAAQSGITLEDLLRAIRHNGYGRGKSGEWIRWIIGGILVFGASVLAWYVAANKDIAEIKATQNTHADKITTMEKKIEKVETTGTEVRESQVRIETLINERLGGLNITRPARRER